MKRFFFSYLTGAMLLAALLPDLSAQQKNCYDVNIGNPPDRFETLLKTEPEKWDFNFRRYGDESSVLVSDPILQRNVQSGTETTEQRLTALYVAANNEGFDIIVFSAEHGIRDALSKGTAVPGNSLEIFFAPGDADTEKIEHYYQFITDMESTKILDFPWLVETRNFRRLRDAVQCTTRKVSNGYVTRIHVPWEILYNKLPFQDKADNFWRLSVIRWAPGGGQTWGGVVHAATTAGYIRFPHYTDEQKAEIQEYVLNRAWEKYRRDLATYGSALVMDMKEPYRKELPKRPRSFMNMQEDRVFVEKVLIPMEKERNDLGAGIASFSGMTPEERDAFYGKAADMLMNFDYDVQEAYRTYLAERLFKN